MRNNKIHRVDVINTLLKHNQGTSYLEIGVRRGETISQIKANLRVGVDPGLQIENITPKELKKGLEGANFHKITSDDFFKENTEKFDVIFIDGLHVYDQVMKDILNSLNILKEKGFIVVHDCNPTTKKAADRIQTEGVWNGDVWKAIYDVKENYRDVDYFVLDEDFGLGILSFKNEAGRSYLPKFKDEIAKLTYEFLEKKRKEILNLKDAGYFHKKFKPNKLDKVKNSLMHLFEKKDQSLCCIYLIDEFAWNDYIPWQESLKSVANIVDELIIVKGTRDYSSKGESVNKFLENIKQPKIKVIDCPWPENFSWLDIAHALNIGLLHCKSDWCFRLLMDEVLPLKDFKDIKKVLSKIKNYDVATVGRYYLLGDSHIYPYIEKELFFRNKKNFVFGRVLFQENMPLIFDNPIKLDGSNVDFFALTPSQYKKIYPVYPPLGKRDSYKKIKKLDKFIINTDVNFLPEEMIIRQKKESFGGYLNLPKEYGDKCQNKNIDMDDIIPDHLTKIRKMLNQKNKIIKISLSDDMKRFVNQFPHSHNSIQKLFYEQFK